MSKTINFSAYQFHSVIKLPEHYEVYDFTSGYDPERSRSSEYGVGKYNEKRAGMYDAELFSGVRNIHMGIDIAAPLGTAVHAFFDGTIYLFGNNAAQGDYGFTLITHHRLDETDLYALHGHLSEKSIQGKIQGAPIKKGEIIAWVGDRHENGGWNPHLHFQLSYEKPEKPDLPGVVSEEDRNKALEKFPDPRLVLGPLY